MRGTGADFFFCDLPHTKLTPALTKTLAGYRRLHGHVDQVFDLTQTPTTCPRTWLKDGSLPVLTRGCKFFAERCSRFLSGPEALIAQGWALHRSMRGFSGSLSDVFAGQSDRCVTGYAGNGMHCASVGLVLHWILINGSVLNDGGGNLASGSSPLGAPSVRLYRKELRDIAGSDDRLNQLHAAGKLLKQQLLYLNFPVDADVPNETCSVGPPEPVSQDATTADSDVREYWVSELLQSVADVS